MPGKPKQRGVVCGRNACCMSGTSGALYRGPRSIGRQSQQGRCAGQLGMPVVQLLCQHATCQVLPLPGSEVCILQRQWRQIHLILLAMREVKLAQLTEQDPHRPSIGHDVVQGVAKQMLVVCQPDQAGTQQWPGSQIEWTVCLFTQML
ncbi:hypothetical protein IGB42_04270 [Andreprevotia sp. IGB-42]|nr:hypothetical protein IGB42_04270 [Andreprevotia sp. IGB-42]